MTADLRLGGLELGISEEDLRAVKTVVKLAERKLDKGVLTKTCFDSGEKKGGIIFNGPQVNQYGERAIKAFKSEFPHLAEILDVISVQGKVKNYDTRRILVVDTGSLYRN